MWVEKFLKVIPAAALLFCVLEILELVLIVQDMNKTEKLEAEIINNLKAVEDITILLNGQLKHFQDKKIKVKE
ncbi:hypothetical protein ACOWN8_00165 [Helicobacter pylori]